MRNAIWRIAKLVPVVVAFEDCLYGPAVVQGRSMQPTLCPDGVLRREVVLAEKWSIKLYRFHRGDVVLLRCHTFPDNVTAYSLARWYAPELSFRRFCDCMSAGPRRTPT